MAYHLQETFCTLRVINTSVISTSVIGASVNDAAAQESKRN